MLSEKAGKIVQVVGGEIEERDGPGQEKRAKLRGTGEDKEAVKNFKFREWVMVHVKGRVAMVGVEVGGLQVS